MTEPQTTNTDVRNAHPPDQFSAPLQHRPKPSPSIFLNLPITNPYSLEAGGKSLNRPRIFPSMLAHTTYSTGRSANLFFHNPDLCTILAKFLKNDFRTMLTFRSLTRTSYHTAMTEESGRKALLLRPDPEHSRGEMKYYIRSSTRILLPSKEFDAELREYPFVIHDADLIMPEIYTSKKSGSNNKVTCSWSGDGGTKIITVHPAVSSIFIQRKKFSAFRIPDTYDFTTIAPMHLDMHLTQPPAEIIEQTGNCARVCKFRHVRLPYFIIEREGGVRLRDVIGYFEGKGEFFHHRCICWEVGGVVSLESLEGRKAVENSRRRDREGLGNWRGFWGRRLIGRRGMRIEDGE